MFRFFENLVDPYCDYPENDNPPQKLWPFLWEYCLPFRPLFAATAALTMVTALIEVWLIAYLGRLVDLLGSADVSTFWGDHGTEMLVIGIFLLFLRPLVQTFTVSLLNNGILPNIGTLVRWRAHSHVLRQSVGWFENDFAGRIAKPDHANTAGGRRGCLSGFRRDGLFDGLCRWCIHPVVRR